MDLAQLWGDQGKQHDARDLLLPTYEWFAEGSDTAYLKHANALLDEFS